MKKNMTSNVVPASKKACHPGMILGRDLWGPRLKPFGDGQSTAGFTLLELLIVISIIAILAAAIIPNFVGFDTEARVATTQSNLNTLRTRVTLYRAKEGNYPERIEQLTEETYDDLGVERAYLDKLPGEMISSSSGNNSVENMTSKDVLSNDGGWTYLTDKANVVVDATDALSKRWGSYENEDPSKW